MSGEAVNDIVPSPKVVGEIEQCRWVSEFGAADVTLVQTQTARSNVWATSVPEAIRNYERFKNKMSKSDQEEMAKAKRLAGYGKDLPPNQACKLFVSMAEIAGAPDGANLLVSYNAFEGRLSVTGQICTLGTFTSVMIVRRGLRESPAIEKAVKRALGRAHERAVRQR
ncbi:MAG: hypothetical protein ACRDOT_07005 [Aeromicrobium sp.]